MKTTPRQKIEALQIKNKEEGFYGIANQFINLIESRLREKALCLLNSLTKINGTLFSNERIVYNEIYNKLLDGVSLQQIKKEYKNS